MSGERDLDKLFRGLDVHLHDGVYAFVTDPSPRSGAVMTMQEREGWTSVVAATPATPAEQRFAWVELTVHSDLNAVGFLARIATALAAAGIPCNAIAGFYHDHIFVPESRANDAKAAILALRSDD